MQLAASGPVLVSGPGAIGALVAARLAAAGTDVVVACRTPEAAADLNHRGVVAIAADGSRVEARPRAVHSPRQLRQAPCMAILATKCQAAEAALQTWLPSLADDAPVVSMQNGVMGDPLAALAGERLVECTVAFPATLDSPGVSHQTGPGGFIIGPWPLPHARDEPAAYRAVAQVLSDVAPVRASGNMLGVKWTKLIVNSCISTLGVATGQELGVLLRDPTAQQVFLRIVEEGHAVGRAESVRFEAVSGFRPALFAARIPGRRLLLAIVARRYRRHRSSSLQSLERGQRTEVDYLNGHIASAARRRAIPAPINEALVSLVHRIEQGETRPSAAHLKGILAHGKRVA
ncbi:MAG: ketopantoate reductase family protein [Thermoplasmatota archaeon]